MRTSDWSNGYCPYLNVDVSIQSQNGDTATYAYTVTYFAVLVVYQPLAKPLFDGRNV